MLGFAGGPARLTLGGPDGRGVVIEAGDVLVLPTGIDHCRIDASDDFLVVGACPPDWHWDICRDAPTARVRERMAHVVFPASNPLVGAAGLPPKLWIPA